MMNFIVFVANGYFSIYRSLQGSQETGLSSKIDFDWIVSSTIFLQYMLTCNSPATLAYLRFKVMVHYAGI